MNYCQIMDSTIEFIEAHLKEELTVQQLADRVGYSFYHFCRIFSRHQGISPMDYIHKRRLSVARTELTRGRKILDIALEYGYETASGFAKSFRREFGYSPSTYAARMSGMDFQTGLSKIGGDGMNPIFVKKEAFRVAGYGLPTNLTNSRPKEAAAYWDTYTGENLESKMYALLNPPKHGEVGICVIDDRTETVYYILGVIVENFDRVTPDMMTVEVPAAEYAVFTTPEVDLSQVSEGQEDPLALAVKATWKYVLEEWFPKSGFQYDESKIGFEFYDERCHNRPDSTMDIYVPILPK